MDQRAANSYEIPVNTGIQYPAGSLIYWIPACAGISSKLSQLLKH